MANRMYFGIGIVLLLGTCFYVASRPAVCRFKVKTEPTIATVKYGPFVENIPQTGIVEFDFSMRCHNVKAFIDQLYLPRITIGLQGTTIINDTVYRLAITNVDPTVNGGHFSIDMNFCDEVPTDISDGKELRMRIELSDPSDEILLPVGNFYFHTGGRWIYVVKNGNRAIRRDIKLGRKMGAEYFEVLSGLKPGEKVIISSYEKFNNLDSLNIMELNEFSN
jgi:hypothetical protein